MCYRQFGRFFRTKINIHTLTHTHTKVERYGEREKQQQRTESAKEKNRSPNTCTRHFLRIPCEDVKSNKGRSPKETRSARRKGKAKQNKQTK